MLDIDASHMPTLDIADFVGKSIALLGITGSGKTNTAAVLIEEQLLHGLPMTIVDIEGEYWGLKERYDLLVVGRSEHSELPLTADTAATLAEVSLSRGVSVILDLSDYTQDESYELLIAYFTRLWEVAGTTKCPYQIILEEAHEWIPQGANTPLKQILTRIALRGRKRGLGIILMSQRSAKVEKDVLTQASLLFLHKVMHPIDIKVYKDLLPLPPARVEEMIGRLQPGGVLILHNHAVQSATIRLRHTFHAGSTPTMEAGAQPELKRVDASLLQELQALLASSKQEKTPDTERKHLKRITELESVLKERDARIAELETQNAILSKLSVSVSSPETMEIRQATVHSMTTHGKSAAPTVVESSLASSNHRQPVQAIVAPFHEAKFISLKNRIERTGDTPYRMLFLLTEKEQSLSTKELAAWLNLSESTILRADISALVKIRLLSRKKYSNGFYYQSLIRDYLRKEFPGVDVERLVQQLSV